MADECPICLTDVDAPTSLPCGHALCHPCVRELFAVQQSTLATWKSGHLSCPLCRAEHKVHNNDVDATFGKSAEPSSSRPASARVVARDGLRTLTVGELRAVAAALGLEAAHPDRADIEAAVLASLSLDAAASVRALPVRALRAILALREIPCDDLLEARELGDRVAASARGSCFELPPKVLKKMLGAYGLGGEQYVDKANLARRVMAARAAAQAARRRKPPTPRTSATRVAPATPRANAPAAEAERTPNCCSDICSIL